MKSTQVFDNYSAIIKTGVDDIVIAGKSSNIQTGVSGMSIVGDYGRAISGTYGFSFAGEDGESISGESGASVVKNGLAKSDINGTAISYSGIAQTDINGVSIVIKHGIAISGEEGVSIGCFGCKAKSGKNGMVAIIGWNFEKKPKCNVCGICRRRWN